MSCHKAPRLTSLCTGLCTLVRVFCVVLGGGPQPCSCFAACRGLGFVSTSHTRAGLFYYLPVCLTIGIFVLRLALLLAQALALLGLAHCPAFAGGGAADDLPQIGSIHNALSVTRPDTIPDGSWFTSAELGAINTSGNTTGTSISGKVDARHETPDWSNEYIVSGFFFGNLTTYGQPVPQRQVARFSKS